MTKYWMLGLALMLGYLPSTAIGQYAGPAYGNNLGPSVYPLRSQSALGLPSVPTGYNAQQPTSYGLIGPTHGQYHLVGTQQAHQGPANQQPTAAPAIGQNSAHAHMPATAGAAVAPGAGIAPGAMNPGTAQVAPGAHAMLPGQANPNVALTAPVQSLAPAAPGCSSCSGNVVQQGAVNGGGLVPSAGISGGYIQQSVPNGAMGGSSCGNGYIVQGGLSGASVGAGAISGGATVAGIGQGMVGSPGVAIQAPAANQVITTTPGQVITTTPGAVACGAAPVSSYVSTVVPGASYGVSSVSSAGSGFAVQGKPWFFGASGLIFNRVDNKRIPLSFLDTSFGADVLTTRDARQGAAGGVEFTLGRYFNCGRNAIQFSYWGVYPQDENVTRSGTAGLYRSYIPYSYLQMAGTPAAPTTPYSVYDWYDNAVVHQLHRSFEYHNVEANLLGFAVGGAARNFNMGSLGTLFSGFYRNPVGTRGCGHCGGTGCGTCGFRGRLHGGCSGSCGSTCGGSCGTTSCGSSCGGSCGSSSCGGSCGASTVSYCGAGRACGGGCGLGGGCRSRNTTGPCSLIAPSCGSRLNMTWIAGFRYFRFRENLFYAASLDDGSISRAADDIYYDVNTTNDLFGFQIGSRLDYCVGCRLNVYGFGKVGVYNNRSTLYSRIGTDFDYAYLDDTRGGNIYQGQDYLIDETKDSVAFLSEIGTGFGYRITCRCTATMGYRAVIASGVATSTDNVRSTFDHYGDVRDYNNYGTLILHGLNFGAQCNF